MQKVTKVVSFDFILVILVKKSGAEKVLTNFRNQLQ